MGLPELVVTGLPNEAAVRLLNNVAARLGHSDAPPMPGARITFENGWPSVELVELADPSVHLKMALGLYPQKVRGVQLVYADDDEGRMPWEHSYNDGHGSQPVLGPCAPASRPDES